MFGLGNIDETQSFFDCQSPSIAPAGPAMMVNISAPFTSVKSFIMVAPRETVVFELDGQSFVGLNGGPTFKFNEAISMIVNCENAGRSRFLLAKAVRGRR
jgi:hypothetical protein